MTLGLHPQKEQAKKPVSSLILTILTNDLEKNKIWRE